MNNKTDSARANGKREFRSVLLFTLAIFVIVTVFSLATGSGGSVSYQVSDGVLGVGGLGTAAFLEIAEIESIETVDHLEIGEKISGAENKDVYSGTYCNGAFGEYDLYAFTDAQEFVVVRHTDGVLVFGGKKSKENKKFCELLEENMASQAGDAGKTQ
ncbi:MAG: hypothetical protein ACI3XJ_11340 [Oscillospiraceae bacterium]